MSKMFVVLPRRKLLQFLVFILLAAFLCNFLLQQSAKSGSDVERPEDYRTRPDDTLSLFPSVSSSEDITHPLHLSPPPGFMAFSHLYVFNGTLFAVVPDQETKESYPELKYIISLPVAMGQAIDEPTDREMQILTKEEAKPILGPLHRAIPIKGFSIILYDISQFMGHYYHWWGEIILGTIRSYSSLALQPGMESPLMEITRFIIPNVHDASWRDFPGIDAPLMRAAFPSASIENADFWKDLTNLQRPFVFERAMVVDRAAAHRSPLASKWYKMISSTMNLSVPRYFWEPLRQRLVQNVVGHISDSSSQFTSESLPLVLYVSRQANRGRRLLDLAHADLVRALKELEVQGICKVKIQTMEELGFREQVELVTQAVIMVGVHGNGLTHQLWMPPSTRSTVIEIFFPQTYVHDYSMLSRNVGHKHYGIWNDTILTYPEGKWFDGTTNSKELHGSNIPVDGETVATIIRERLSNRLIEII